MVNVVCVCGSRDGCVRAFRVGMFVTDGCVRAFFFAGHGLTFMFLCVTEWCSRVVTGHGLAVGIMYVAWV
mgnify:FL=1